MGREKENPKEDDGISFDFEGNQPWADLRISRAPS
jgi:hypothetical protein